MYSEQRGHEKKCVVCGKRRAVCGLTPTYCKPCAAALQTGKPEKSYPSAISSQHEPGLGEMIYNNGIDRRHQDNKKDQL